MIEQPAKNKDYLGKHSVINSVAIVLVAFAITFPSFGNAMKRLGTAKDYLISCEGAANEELEPCTNYIAGLYEGITLGLSIHYTRSSDNTYADFCPNEEPKIIELHNNLIDFIIKNPEQLIYPVSMVALGSFKAAYPCSESSSD